MRNYLFAFSSIISIGLFYIILSGNNPFGVDPKVKEEVIIKAVRTHLQQVHYAPQNIDDDFSSKAFDLYIKYLDGNKRFLTQVELDKLNLSRNLIDDQLNANSLIFFDESDLLIEKAIERAENIFEELLNTVQHCSLGQITKVLYKVGGSYRRNM